MERVKTYICVDVEAALIRGRQYIIEIGAVKWLPDGTTENFTQLIQPYKFKKLNYHIQKLTGITTEELLDAPSFKEAIYKFKRWCKGDYVFLTFGEFDRKVFEEELARNYINRDFLYPMVDFQQKYMIEHALKEQPSLGGLMATLELEVDTQHRALADADSLLRIFQTVNGEYLLEKQRTNEFSLLLSNFKQLETTFDLVLSYTKCRMENGHIVIDEIRTIREYLPFEVREEERVTKEGEKQISLVTTIKSSDNAKQFLEGIVEDVPGRVLITRTGLRSVSRILRLHHSGIPKTEVMTLMNILSNEEAVSKFNIGEETIHAYEAKISRLLHKFEGPILDEFMKRALLPAETVAV